MDITAPRLVRALTAALLGALGGCATSEQADIRGTTRELHHDWSPVPCFMDRDSQECSNWRTRVDEVLAVAARLPRDPYVQGQAVFALTRAAAFEEAHTAVDGCRVEGWWCRMLRGHVLAESEDLVAAEDTFAVMLLGMPGAQRCEWTDLSQILPAGAWRRYESDDCLEQEARNETVWWLSDPSYLVPGSDAKVEHYNRMAWAALHDDQLLLARGRAIDDGEGHSTSHHRQTLRGGMHDVDFERAWRSESRPTYSVIPSEEALLDPLHASREAWDLDPDPTDVQMVIGWGRVDTLDAQVAFFERGDDIVATAALDLPASTLFPGDADLGAALILRAGADETVFIAATDEPRRRYVFRQRAPRGRYLVAVEARSHLGVGRTRFGHGLPHLPGAPVRLSDILLYTPSDREGVDSLEEALPRMRGGREWERGEIVGLYLEVYGPDDLTSYDVSVTLKPEGSGGLFGRLGRLLGGGPGDPIEVTWRQQTEEGVIAVGLTVGLDEVEPGEYTIEAALRGTGLSAATVSRRIEVVEGG